MNLLIFLISKSRARREQFWKNEIKNKEFVLQEKKRDNSIFYNFGVKRRLP